MTLPHFEIWTFPNQLFWLLVAAGVTYVFNKLFFIPSLSSSITKREEMISQYVKEIERINSELLNVRSEIDALLVKGRAESKTIIDLAVTKSQAHLFNSMQMSNQNLTNSMREYDKYLEDYKTNLSENMRFIITDIKDKVYQLITMQNT
jgi:F-type H+-transporting ATPase subunit b